MKRVTKYVAVGLMLILLVVVGVLSCRAPEEPPVEPTPAEPTPVEAKVLKVGGIYPLSGPEACYGLPESQGLHVWADDMNARGGIEVGGVTYTFQVFDYDDKGNIPAEALKCARKAVLEDGVRYFFGNPTPPLVEAIAPFFLEHEAFHMLMGASSALNPAWPNLIATNTGWPQYAVLGMQHVRESYPEVQRVAITTIDAPYGEEEMLWATIAVKAQGFDIVFQEFHAPDTVDWYPVLTPLLATEPDLIYLGTVAQSVSPALVETARALGYTGKWYNDSWSITLLLEKVPLEYIEGFVAPKPDIDDPALAGEDLARLYQEYVRRWPGEWLPNVYAPWLSFSLMVKGMELADSVDPHTVWETLEATQPIEHPMLGESYWGGEEMFGINTFLMTPCFIGEIRGGKHTIVANLSFAEWYKAHKDVVLTEMKAAGRLP